MEISLLALDDNPGDLEILRRSLEGIDDLRVGITTETDHREGLRRLASGSYDVLVLDYRLGLESGLDLLQRVKEEDPRQAVIMLTGAGNEQVAVEAMKGGALDYLVKGDLTTASLRKALQNVLDKRALHERIEEQNRRLARQALTDELTGLYNRHHLMERFDEEVRRARRYGTPLSILLIDLDHFKAVNDLHGHLAGDRVLSSVADLIRRQIRTTDIPTRYGGDEFCILAVESDLRGAEILAERLRRAIAGHPFLAPDGHPVRITASIGVAQAEGRLRSLEALFQRADKALYEAKHKGRNRCTILTPPAGTPPSPAQPGKGEGTG